MRLIKVYRLSTLSAVLASLAVITSASQRTPLLTNKGELSEIKQEQLSLSSNHTLCPPPLAKRVEKDDLVLMETGQGWTERTYFRGSYFLF